MKWFSVSATPYLFGVFFPAFNSMLGVGSWVEDGRQTSCYNGHQEPLFEYEYPPSLKLWRAGECEDEHDNIWCRKPEETIAFMKDVKVPWIAYKVLAAGAINPTVGFKYALQNGVDFLCVGMLDFQVAENVAILKGQFKRGIKRERPWRA